MDSEKANKNKVCIINQSKSFCVVEYGFKELVVTEIICKSGMIALRRRANNDFGKDFSLPQDTPYLVSFSPSKFQRLQTLATM